MHGIYNLGTPLILKGCMFVVAALSLCCKGVWQQSWKKLQKGQYLREIHLRSLPELEQMRGQYVCEAPRHLCICELWSVK